MDMTPIVSFRNEYRFLSNFYKCSINIGKILYPSAEHAYVAHKTTDIAMRRALAKINEPHEVKKLGRGIRLDKKWHNEKIFIMHDIVMAKFSQNPQLRDQLIDTGDRILVEGNTWKDQFWGESPLGVGGNHLGKILMAVRARLSVENNS